MWGHHLVQLQPSAPLFIVSAYLNMRRFNHIQKSPKHTKTIPGWWFQPLWKIWVRQLGWWNSQYMESNKSHVPNHQLKQYGFEVAHSIDRSDRSQGKSWPDTMVQCEGLHQLLPCLLMDAELIGPMKHIKCGVFNQISFPPMTSNDPKGGDHSGGGAVGVSPFLGIAWIAFLGKMTGKPQMKNGKIMENRWFPVKIFPNQSIDSW